MSAKLEPGIGVGPPESVDDGDLSRFCGSTPSSLGLHAADLPVPGPDGYDLSTSVLYLNRELTWLNFNWRVEFLKLGQIHCRAGLNHLQSLRANPFFFQPWLLTYLLFYVSSPILFDVFRSRN